MNVVNESLTETGIPLADMIETLRQELQTAWERGKEQDVHFEVGTVDLELKVAISRKTTGNADLAFWVIKAGGELEHGGETIHTFKLSLIPKFSSTGSHLEVSKVTTKLIDEDK